MDRFSLQANLGSTRQLTSILGHFWPMRVPVRLNFAKVCLNFSAAVCSWLVSRGIFRCRNDLGCFSFSFQHRIRQERECKVSTESDQFSFKDKKRRQSVTSCNTCVLKQGHRARMRRKRLAFCYFDRANAFHLFTDLIEMSFAPLKLRSIIVRAQLLQEYG